jgi:spermidine dehydrogenase
MIGLQDPIAIRGAGSWTPAHRRLYTRKRRGSEQNMSTNGWNEEDVELGLDRNITRRDFLQGMALAVGAAASRGRRSRISLSPPGPSDYPPLRQGLQGQNPGAMALGHRVRDGELRDLPPDVPDSGESYDLVVVGAGIAGLGSAYLYHQESPHEPSILILDNHDDFGGHARRNVMEVDGVRLIAQGGTFALEEPEDSPEEALEIFRRIGLDADRLVEYRDPDFRKRFRLSPSVVFDSRVFSGATTTWVNGFYETRYQDFFGKAPLSESSRKDLIELYTTRKNYLPDSKDVRVDLFAMSWEKFVRDKMGLGDDAVRFVNLYATDLIGLGCDAACALEGYHVGPGFFGMGGEGFFEKDGILRYGYQPVNRFPDGNHTIARQLLKGLLPQVLSGDATMEGVFNARVLYDELDKKENRVRLRLSSMVVRIEQSGQSVAVTYVEPDGTLHRVQAKHVIMTGWGSVAKHVVAGLPEEQRRALEEYRYCSALYINVLLRQWRPIADIGAFEMFWPDGYCTWMHVSDPLTVGAYRPEYHPDKPTILSMYKYIYEPGLDPKEQMELGRYQMERTTFEQYEREIRRELNHVLGPHGFDAARDIAGITVNRWGHGYTYFKEPGSKSRLENPPYREGRKQLGRISFAGADAAGNPWTQAALAQAFRAVHEQLLF